MIRSTLLMIQFHNSTKTRTGQQEPIVEQQLWISINMCKIETAFSMEITQHVGTELGLYMMLQNSSSNELKS